MTDYHGSLDINAVVTATACRRVGDRSAISTWYINVVHVMKLFSGAYSVVFYHGDDEHSI